MQQAPWKLAERPGVAAELDATLYTAAEALRIATALLAPVLPESAAKIWTQLGMADPLEAADLAHEGQVRLSRIGLRRGPTAMKIAEASSTRSSGRW